MSIPNSDYQFVGVNHLELIHIGSWPGGCCPAGTPKWMIWATPALGNLHIARVHVTLLPEFGKIGSKPIPN